jgi:hypothetical protein
MILHPMVETMAARMDKETTKASLKHTKKSKYLVRALLARPSWLNAAQTV